MNDKKVAVIGGGAAGLCAARHCTAPVGVEGGVTVFEQSSQLGGTWVYTEETNIDRYGIPVHTSMYKNLRTNLPKEIMGFPDFPIPERDESYIPAEAILKFLNDYADHFDLRKYIKFNHKVQFVSPEQDGKWKVEALNLETNEKTVEEFDAVMVCNGHYHTPIYPEVEGMETFSGQQLHSHHYRKPETYKDKTVLVIGGGPSGLDIALDISYFAKKVVISHHVQEVKTKFPKNIFQKPDVLKVDNATVFFSDGSTEDFNVILFCTGYLYSFPFLSKECGVTVEDNFVQPLYKHLIHIYRPTMCFIGLPFYVCAFILFDIQVRVFLKVLSGETILPSVNQMLEDVKREIKWRSAMGLKKKHFHLMGEFQEQYYDELSAVGNVPPVPSVYCKLHDESSKQFNNDLINFRKSVYKIVNDKNFLEIK
ncbi:uncharacterized protein LOC142328861 [Lycorma delicatula]|uniref:uncharacterized protein LOC142328861 n=1 Tax=Lycorma delicatula TaxID=130591 RepID=UPI003F514897